MMKWISPLRSTGACAYPFPRPGTVPGTVPGSHIFLRPEEEERPEDAEDEIGDEAERRKPDVELPVVGSDREDLVDGEEGDAEDVDRPHVEIAPLLHLAQAPDFRRVDIRLPEPVPEEVLHMERVAVRRFEKFALVERMVGDAQRVMLEEIVDKRRADRLGKSPELDPRERRPDPSQQRVLPGAHDGCADHPYVEEHLDERLLRRGEPVERIEKEDVVFSGDRLGNEIMPPGARK